MKKGIQRNFLQGEGIMKFIGTDRLVVHLTDEKNQANEPCKRLPRDCSLEKWRNGVSDKQFIGRLYWIFFIDRQRFVISLEKSDRKRAAFRSTSLAKILSIERLLMCVKVRKIDQTQICFCFISVC